MLASQTVVWKVTPTRQGGHTVGGGVGLERIDDADHPGHATHLRNERARLTREHRSTQLDNAVARPDSDRMWMRRVVAEASPDASSENAIVGVAVVALYTRDDARGAVGNVVEAPLNIAHARVNEV